MHRQQICLQISSLQVVTLQHRTCLRQETVIKASLSLKMDLQMFQNRRHKEMPEQLAVHSQDLFVSYRLQQA